MIASKAEHNWRTNAATFQASGTNSVEAFAPRAVSRRLARSLASHPHIPPSDPKYYTTPESPLQDKEIKNQYKYQAQPRGWIRRLKKTQEATCPLTRSPPPSRSPKLGAPYSRNWSPSHQQVSSLHKLDKKQSLILRFPYPT